MSAVIWRIMSLGLVGLLAACETAPGTIRATVPLEEDQFLVTDSRQRVVTNSEIGSASRPGLVDPVRIVCTEPSPDVAVAVANSFGFGLSVLGQGSGSISGAQAQGMAQLAERTAAIQLLRDKMYQTCLAYSNGAISGTTYSLIMARLDDTIVSMLLGETAGGAFGRKLAALGVGADAEASASLLAGLSSGLDGVQGAAGELAEIDEEIENKDEVLQVRRKVVTDKEIAGETPTDAERQAVTDAETELADARRRKQALMQLLKDSAEATSRASAAVSNLTAGGDIQARPDPEVAAVLGRMQKNFVDDDFTDSYVSACLIDLSLQKSSGTGIQETASTISKAQQADNARFSQLLLRLEGIIDNYMPKRGDDGFKADLDIARNGIFQGLAQVRTSALSEFCRNHLEDDIDRALEIRREVREKEIEAEKLVGLESAKVSQHAAATNRMKAFQEALVACGTLPDSERATCRAAVMGVGAN